MTRNLPIPTVLTVPLAVAVSARLDSLGPGGKPRALKPDVKGRF
jgi:hypothetical protein